MRLADIEREEREAYIRLRLSEAVQALRRSPFPERFLARLDEDGQACFKSLWPDYQRSSDELWYASWSGVLPGTRTRVHPTRAQLTAMEEVLPWMVFWIPNSKVRQAVFLKAWPMGFRRIGQKLGVSHETARTWERQGIALIAQHLAGKS